MICTHSLGLRILAVALVVATLFVGAVRSEGTYDLAFNEDFNHGVKCRTKGTTFFCEIVPMGNITTTTTAEPQRPLNWPPGWPVVPSPYEYFCKERNDPYPETKIREDTDRSL